MKTKRLHTEEAEIAYEAMRQNKGYCPCKIEKNDDTKCICKEFREGDLGICHCGVYEKTEI